VTWRREHHRLDYSMVGGDEARRKARAGDGMASAASSARKPTGAGAKKRPKDLRGTA
jgi:hypothetical protein